MITMSLSPLVTILLLVGCALSSAAPTAWPEILPYEPVADNAAVVHSSDGMARFTVLSSRLLRMEYTDTAHKFEDRATTAIVNRAITPVPAFTYTEAASGALQITTNDVVLVCVACDVGCAWKRCGASLVCGVVWCYECAVCDVRSVCGNPYGCILIQAWLSSPPMQTYIVGEKFTPDTLSVSSTDAEQSAFKTWSYGEPNTGNLLGTIKV